MSDDLDRTLLGSSVLRRRRTQFRSFMDVDDPAEQPTLKVPVAMPGTKKQRGQFLPARQREQQEQSLASRNNHVIELSQGTVNEVVGERLDVKEVETALLPALLYGTMNRVVGEGLDADMIETAPLLALPGISWVHRKGNGTWKEPVTPPNQQAIVTVAPGAGQPFEVKTSGFDIDDPEWDMRSTIPMMVLQGIAKQQGKQQQEMKSEVSGAASAAGLVGFGNILGSVFKYVSTFLIQYSFGPGIYGIYTLSTSLVNLISSIFSLGMGDAMLRYVAIYRNKKKPRLVLGITIFCTAMAGIAGIIGALLLLYFTPAFVSIIALKHDQASNKESSLVQVMPALQMMAPLIPLFTMQLVWQSGLRGFKAFKLRVLVSSVLQPLLQIMLTVLVILFFSNITGIVLALLLSTLFSVILNLYFMFKQVASVAIPEIEQYEAREWLGFASLNFLTTVTDNLLYFMDALLLAVFNVPTVQIGQYGAATRISNFISLPLLSLNNIFAPTIAELHSKGEREKLESLFKVVTKWTITFSLPLFLVSALFSPYLLGLSGAAFVPAWPLVVALAFGALLNAGTGAVGYMLLMTGYNKLSFLNSLVAVIANVALGVVLIPRYGAIGTAIGTGVSFCVVNLMRLLQVRLLLKMHPYRWDVIKPIGAGLLSSAVIGAIFYLLYLSHLKLYMLLGHAILSIQLLFIPVFLALYIGLVVLFKGSPEDEIVMKGLRKKFLRGKKKGGNKKKRGNIGNA